MSIEPELRVKLERKAKQFMISSFLKCSHYHLETLTEETAYVAQMCRIAQYEKSMPIIRKGIIPRSLHFIYYGSAIAGEPLENAPKLLHGASIEGHPKSGRRNRSQLKSEVLTHRGEFVYSFIPL